MAEGSLGYSALDIAKWFINAADREAGDAITHLKVQKLVYYAQGWAMVYLGKPLFDEDMQAWAHGPVVPSVWNHFRDQGYQALPVQKITKRVGDDVAQLLASVNERYGIYSAKKLEHMTHSEPPWKNARKGLPAEARCTETISKDDIRAFFEAMKPQA